MAECRERQCFGNVPTHQHRPVAHALKPPEIDPEPGRGEEERDQHPDHQQYNDGALRGGRDGEAR